MFMLKKPFKMSSIRRLCGSFLAVVCVAHSIDSVRVWPSLPNNQVISKPQPINGILELDNALYSRVARRVK